MTTYEIVRIIEASIAAASTLYSVKGFRYDTDIANSAKTIADTMIKFAFEQQEKYRTE